MRKKSLLPYVSIFLFLLVLLSFSKQAAIKLQGVAAAFFSPLWKPLSERKPAGDLEASRSHLDNHLLTAEVLHLREMYQEELLILKQLKSSQELEQAANLLQRKHKQDFQNLLIQRLQTLSAKVIFRSPSSWNSSLWINVGRADNEILGKTIVMKNSPVLVGFSVIGVVDYVGNKQSRVRLITDSGLTPSVRVLRGDLQAQKLEESIDRLIAEAKRHQDQFVSNEDSDQLIEALEKGKKALNTQGKSLLLAKGEIHGSSLPLWRKDSHLLKGIGFNYDFSDEEGPARDLRTGKSSALDDEKPLPLIKENDLLVTTGMDGVFPPGLQVAEVRWVKPLKEGDYYYEILAEPTAGNLEGISSVMVIPPLGYDENEQPPMIGW